MISAAVGESHSTDILRPRPEPSPIGTPPAYERLGSVTVELYGQHRSHTYLRVLLSALAFTLVTLLAVGVVTLWFTRRLTAPLERLSSTVAAMRGGDLPARIPISEGGELRGLGLG